MHYLQMARMEMFKRDMQMEFRWLKNTIQVELPIYKQGEKLKNLQPSISKFNAMDYTTNLTEDESDFVYNGAMEIANKIDIPECFNWDVLGHLYNDVESEEAEFIELMTKS